MTEPEEKLQTGWLLESASIYAIPLLLGRLSSILLLPVYTRFLDPFDYGVIAILDLTTAVVAGLFHRGLIPALGRHHFDHEDEGHRDRVWWTCLSLIGVTAVAFMSLAVVWREPFAEFLLGDLEGAPFYLLLALSALWLEALGEVPHTYIRIQRRAWLFVQVFLVRLGFNIALSLFFLVVLRLGLVSLLLANLIGSAARFLWLLRYLVRERGPFALSRPIAGELVRFAAPLALTSLCAVLMHQVDRYFLRVLGSLDDVGRYALAYKVGQGMTSLMLFPFWKTFSVEMFEVERMPDADRIFARVFEYFVYALLVLTLGVALAAGPLVYVLAPASYAGAADLVPIVSLAFLFFGLHGHFKVPAILRKKTITMIPASVAALIVNLIGNVLAIPRFGSLGAAWVSVVTYATFSFVGLWIYRHLDRYPYPFGRCTLIALGMGSSYLALEALPPLAGGTTWMLRGGLVLGWTWVLLARPVRAWLAHRSRPEGRAPP